MKRDEDDYLWDKSGEPDPDVAKLEQTLGELKYRAPASPRHEQPVKLSARAPRSYAAMVMLALAAGLALWLGARAYLSPAPREEGAYFDLKALSGAPLVSGSRVAGQGRLPVGAWLETDDLSQAQIKVAAIGEVQVEPRSRLRLVSTSAKEHRLELERGELRARVTAPPRLFVVDAPSASAVDLGCAYTLRVDPAGRGRLEVTSGQVSLEGRGRASYVPAGAVCETRPGAGPGTPYFSDADGALIEALRRVDFESGGEAALESVLATARRRDSLTLWHLLSRVADADKQKVLDRLHAVDPPSWGGGVPNARDLGPDRIEEYKRDLVTHW
jgi:hypothetical protein